MEKSHLERRAKEEKLSREGRLPPGQSLTQKFPILHYGPVAQFNPATWKFRIWGEVEKEINLTWDEFSKLPQTEIVMDIHCVTRWSMFDTLWSGVTIKTLISEGLLSIKPNAMYVIQHAEFGYTTNLPIEVILADNFLLATHFNREPISPDHGFPVRGVVGNLPGEDKLFVPYFWKGAKWLRGLEFSKNDRPGFWEQAGYHNEADVWKEQRFG